MKPLLGKIPLNKFAPSEPRRYSTSYRRSARAACRRSVVRALVLVNAIAPRYQAMALLATWAGLRYGEAAGLKRADIDLRAGTVRVDRQLQELAGGVLVEGPPKTDAGRRVVALPPHIEAQLAWHLDTFVHADSTSLVFTSPEGTPLRRSNFNRRVWRPACTEVGLSGFRFHDYADIRVMPTLWSSPCSAGLGELKLSA